jgi:hypothetical protein
MPNFFLKCASADEWIRKMWYIQTCTMGCYSALKKDICPDASGSHHNPSYSGGKDQEDRGSKPAQTNSSQDPISKKPIIKEGICYNMNELGGHCAK